MKKLMLLCLFSSVFSNYIFSQNAISILKFEEAEKAFVDKNYNLVLEKLDEVDSIEGPTSKSLYLRIITQNLMFDDGKYLYYSENQLDFLNELRENIDYYLEQMASKKIDDKYREVYRINENLKVYPKTKKEYQEAKNYIEDQKRKQAEQEKIRLEEEERQAEIKRAELKAKNEEEQRRKQEADKIIEDKKQKEAAEYAKMNFFQKRNSKLSDGDFRAGYVGYYASSHSLMGMAFGGLRRGLGWGINFRLSYNQLDHDSIDQFTVNNPQQSHRYDLLGTRTKSAVVSFQLSYPIFYPLYLYGNFGYGSIGTYNIYQSYYQGSYSSEETKYFKYFERLKGTSGLVVESGLILKAGYNFMLQLGVASHGNKQRDITFGFLIITN